MQELIESAIKKLQNINCITSDQYRYIAEEVAKLNSLKAVIVPEQTKQYYIVADRAGGVTEKTSLISKEELEKKLIGIELIADISDLAELEIKADAIIKHPKKGVQTEVQREAFGLQIARLLGFTEVASSTMVSHNGEPCLFVSFDTIELLTTKIDNYESSEANVKPDSGKNIEDFGKYVGFFALCSDPDFIGKKGQNKGIRNNQLYIFDQVFMSNQNLSLDRAFNLVPTFIMSKAPGFIKRHFLGRNKSVVNESKFEEKITGVINLFTKQDEIKKMFDEAIASENSNSVLVADAKKCKKMFTKRLRGYEKLFPLCKEGSEKKPIRAILHDEEKMKVLVKVMQVTQLINKTKVGPGGRAIMFNNPATYVKSFEITGDQVKIEFTRNSGQALSDNKKNILRIYGFSVINDKSITIPVEQLKQMDFEDLSHPNNKFKHLLQQQGHHNEESTKDYPDTHPHN